MNNRNLSFAAKPPSAIFSIILLAFAILFFPTAVFAGATPTTAQLKNTDQAAHWVDQSTFLLPPEFTAPETSLLSYPMGVASGKAAARFPLIPSELTKELVRTNPHLKNYRAFKLTAPLNQKRTLLKGQLFVAGRSGDQYHVHGVQTGEAIDAMFTGGENDADEQTNFGAIRLDGQTQFALWAPTARKVSVQTFDAAFNKLDSIPMREDSSSGVWQASFKHDSSRSADLLYYQYQLEVFHYSTGKVSNITATDPYSLGLAANGQYSLIVDLNDQRTKPAEWDSHQAPTLARPEQHIIYEAHVGDFSASSDDIPLADRAKFSAFQYSSSAPMRHLKELVAAGLNTFQLLPSYDIGTVNEIPTNRLSLQSTVAKACALIGQEAAFCKSSKPTETLAQVLRSYSTTSPDAQALVEAINEADDYNWGYDPNHYTVPEGSYASDANGVNRIVEFRQMVQTLHQMGLRVIMDVVYNHTYRAGLDQASVLDKIVPGYYHRLHPVSGKIEQSTCCENTATERVMMAKLMTDSLVVWARDYKIDGFRFDLMGHQPKAAMLASRDAVRKVDSDTYFYGEGWNFGEVANNAQFVQASQTELAGTSIGTFNDRLRDAVRGGSSFVDGDALRVGQGLANGQFLDPNELNKKASPNARIDYEQNLALTRLGLAGNLRDYPVTIRDGTVLNGSAIRYGDNDAGYALDPADTINYVSKHDNQTLWDNNQYRIPFHASPETRARLQLHGLSYPLLSQGIPFLHMGSELARSKSFLRDSYNFGHWFNRVDFTYAGNNYDVGLPPAVKDQKNWEIIKRIITNNEGRDQLSKPHIEFVKDGFKDLLAIRSQSALFSLPSAEAIKQRLRFLNAGPKQQDGLIVMSIDDGFINPELADLDPSASQLVVVFNHSPSSQDFSYQHAGGLTLHERYAESTDAALTQVRITDNNITIPAYSTVVLVRPGKA